MASKPSQLPPITQIQDGLYLGDGVSSRRREILEEHDIAAVLSLSIGKFVHWRLPWYTERVPEGSHLFIPCNDSSTQDLLPELARVCDFIQTHRDAGSSVLVHCDKGISRSATAMVAYLMRAHQWGPDAALAFVEAKRRVRPNSNFREQLQVWDQAEYHVYLEDGSPKEAYAAYLAIRAERLQALGLTGDEPVGIQSL